MGAVIIGDRSVQETNMRNYRPIAIFIASEYSSIGKLSMIMALEGGRVCDFKGIHKALT